MPAHTVQALKPLALSDEKIRLLEKALGPDWRRCVEDSRRQQRGLLPRSYSTGSTDSPASIQYRTLYATAPFPLKRVPIPPAPSTYSPMSKGILDFQAASSETRDDKISLNRYSIYPPAFKTAPVCGLAETPKDIKAEIVVPPRRRHSA